MCCTDAVAILLNFYEYQAALGFATNYLEPLTDVSFFGPYYSPPDTQTAIKVQPPTVASYQMRLYPSSADTGAAFGMTAAQSQSSVLQNSTPVSAHGGNGTPAQMNSTEEVPEKTDRS